MDKCPKCGSDLTKNDSVTRTYINKDDKGNVRASGHYDEQECFEPDQSVDLSTGRFDLVCGSDTCTNCGIILQ